MKKNKKSKDNTKSVKNRRAKYDYTLEDGFVFGMVLNGNQVRSIREGKVSLTGSYINIKNTSLQLVGAQITTKDSKGSKDSIQHSPPINLLATKQDIIKIKKAKNSSRTIIPTEILTNTRHIKLKANIAKGRKEYEKRDAKKLKEFRIQSKKDFRDI